jgi:hypothetical protein
MRPENAGELMPTLNIERLTESGTSSGFAGFLVSCRAYREPALVPWFDRPDADAHIDALRRAGTVSPEEAGHLRSFVKDGFIILEHAIDHASVDAVNGDIDRALADGYRAGSPHNEYQGHPGGSGLRRGHPLGDTPAIRKLRQDVRYRRILDLVIGVESRPGHAQTCLAGDGSSHLADMVHLKPFPAGMMCGVWIALHDVLPCSGEVVIYKGSHHARRTYSRDVDCEKVHGDWSVFTGKMVKRWAELSRRYERLAFRPRKGTVLIWHEHLMHGGSVRLDGDLQCRAMVIRVYADGAVVHDDVMGRDGQVADTPHL